jgi:hypothetical protein
MAAAMTSHQQLHHDRQLGPAPWFHGRATETGSPAADVAACLDPGASFQCSALARNSRGKVLSSPFPPHEAGLCLATGEDASLAGRDRIRLDACESNRGSRCGGPDAQVTWDVDIAFPAWPFGLGPVAFAPWHMLSPR